MADLRRVVSLAISRLLVTPIVCGVVACNGSSSMPPPPATTPPPVPELVSVRLIVNDSLPSPLADVTVEITSGEDIGKFATTAANGRVTIKGHSLDRGLSLRMSKTGFSSAEMWLASEAGLQQVTLVADVLLDLSGKHQLTVEADGECELPELARTRTYQASITPRNSPWYFDVKLSGAAFFNNLDHFGTYVSSNALRHEIYLQGFEEEDPMLEILSPTEYFAFIGEAKGEAEQADTVIAARFQGAIAYCTGTPTKNSYTDCLLSMGCYSKSHKVILTRQ
jgi:hypothetical protein